MAIVTVSQSSVMLVSLADLKDHLRVDASFDDSYITGAYWAALADAETFTHRALIPQTVQLILDHFPYPSNSGAFNPLYSEYTCDGLIVVPRPRLQAVDFIKYIDNSGTEQTLDPDRYVVDAASEPARIAPLPNSYWPLTFNSITYPLLNTVTVQYQCGYSMDDPDPATVIAAVPPNVLHALKLMVANLYEIRSPVLAGLRAAAVEIPVGLERLLWAQKVIYAS